VNREVAHAANAYPVPRREHSLGTTLRFEIRAAIGMLEAIVVHGPATGHPEPAWEG
jgi:hypothetical protein